MPIADAELDKHANSHLLRPSTETVHAALRAWSNTPGSQEWWWLIIDQGSGQYAALRFEDIRALLVQTGGSVHMNTRLADLPPRRNNPDDWQHPFPGVITPAVIDQEAMGTARALQIMQENPGGMVVVQVGDRFRGILSSTNRTFAFTDQPLLDLLEEFDAPGDTDTIILPPRPGMPEE